MLLVWCSNPILSTHTPLHIIVRRFVHIGATCWTHRCHLFWYQQVDSKFCRMSGPEHLKIKYKLCNWKTRIMMVLIPQYNQSHTHTQRKARVKRQRSKEEKSIKSQTWLFGSKILKAVLPKSMILQKRSIPKGGLPPKVVYIHTCGARLAHGRWPIAFNFVPIAVSRQEQSKQHQ